MKIAILYICTGRYSIFWNDFYNSFNKYFLSGFKKHYFVFTDSTEVRGGNNVTLIYKKCQGFPLDSLFRFKMFLEIEDLLNEYDYIFFFNSNMLCIDYVESNILPSQKERLIGVISPGYYNKNPRTFPYERSQKSKAYVPRLKNHLYYYFMGGFNGGETQAYIDLIRTCCSNIDNDYKNGIVAIYHDESHINKYFFDKQIKILGPEYGFPEGWSTYLKVKIIIRDKVKFDPKFDKNRISLQKKIKNRINRFIRYINW